VVLVFHLGFELREVDAGRAVALTALTADAESEHLLLEPVGMDLVVVELAADGGPKHVRPAAGRLDLLLGGAVGRTHHAGVDFPAGATAVTQLDEMGEPALL